MSGAGWYFIDNEEEQLVLEVLRSRKVSRYRNSNDSVPSKTVLFETEFRDKIKTTYCLGMNSCTSALFTGLLALGVGPGDEVIVPGYTFIATIASVVYAGGVPVLAEVDESLTIDPEDVIKRITRRTKAIIAVHMLGTPCNMEALESIAKEHGLFLIEDVAQACGGSFKGKPLGGWANFGVFSLNVFKILTSGDGGVFTTNDQDLYERTFSIHDHGFNRFQGGTADGDMLFGLNMRMNELTGAMALAQVRKLDMILTHLRNQKKLLTNALVDLPGLSIRKLNDSKGECCTTLVYFAKNAAQAHAITKAIGSKPLANTVKHHYRAMGQLINKRLPNQRCAPFFCSTYPTSVEYKPGMLPRTDSLLERAIGIGVGVTDDFLGFGFGINVNTNADEIIKTANIFRNKVEQVRLAGI